MASGASSRTGSAASSGATGGRPTSPFQASTRGSGSAASQHDSELEHWHTGGTLLPLHRGRGKRRLAGGETPRSPAQLDPQAALLVGSRLHDSSAGMGGGPLQGPSTRDARSMHGMHRHLSNGAGDRGALDSPPRGDSPPPAFCASWRSCLAKEPLLLATLVGVVAGVVLGVALKPADPGQEVVDLIGFPGELMLRLLKMLVLPLVSISMVAGVVSLRQADAGGGGNVRRLAHLTAAFYIGSTVLAILVGIALVVLVHPGRGAPFDRIASAASGGCHKAEAKKVAEHTKEHSELRMSTTEALLSVARQVVPDNIVGAAVDMNVLGIITFSLMFGLALSSLGSAADGLIKTIGVLNAAVQRMVTAALWISPLGIGSLIAASILRACDLLGTLAALGLWVATVIAGLAFFALLALPLLLWAATGRSPLTVARAFAQSLLMAFGTSSSAAALPLAMQSARELGCEESTVNFFLPLGTTVNMNGTALYEATTAIFIAQAHGVHLDAAQLVVVALTASLAAVGAPAIPSAGLVTMLIVLQAVNLDQFAGDLAVILAIDWLLDRVRTTVNLLGDVFGCVLVDDLMKGRRGGLGGSKAGEQIPYIQLVEHSGSQQQQQQQRGGAAGAAGAAVAGPGGEQGEAWRGQQAVGEAQQAQQARMHAHG